jgi:hypothetical protein
MQPECVHTTQFPESRAQKKDARGCNPGHILVGQISIFASDDVFLTAPHSEPYCIPPKELVTVAPSGTKVFQMQVTNKGYVSLFSRTHGPRGGEEVLFYSFMTSALDEGGWSTSRLGRLYPREKPVTYRTGGWVGPRAGLDRCRKSRPHRDSIPGPSSP